MKKYTEQQKNVRNNREFDSLTKETEYQELEIQLAEKNIKEFKAQIELKNESIDAVKATLTEKTDHLKHKKGELDTILKETEKEENMLLNKSEKYKKLIEERLLFAYGKIRSNVKNGLAIVPIERGAAGGSFFTIPPQVQMEIAARKKIITRTPCKTVTITLQINFTAMEVNSMILTEMNTLIVFHLGGHLFLGMLESFLSKNLILTPTVNLF